jgi:uncharacterized membrane protein
MAKKIQMKQKSGMPYPLRIIRARPRLSISALIGILIAILSPSAWDPATRILIGWNVGVWLYLALVIQLMSKTKSHQIVARAATQDEGRFAILGLTVAASLATIAAIIFEIGGAKSPDQHNNLLLAILTILSSWFFIHTIFALHYAHEYYGEFGGKKSGLRFPNDEDPNYWDFVYFSFVIGMTAQVSDVAVSSKAIRQTVTAHSIISFLFNVSLLALTVNIAANVI